MVTDIAILILPMHPVWHLRIPQAQKLAVMGIFLLGGFVCIASIVRLYYLDRISNSDPTWTTFNAATWSTVEVCLGVVSACLPVMSPLFRSVLNTRISINIYSKHNSAKMSKLSNSYASGEGSHGGASRNASLAGPGNGMVPIPPAAAHNDPYADYSLESKAYKATLDRDFEPGQTNGRKATNSESWLADAGPLGASRKSTETGLTNEVKATGRGAAKNGKDRSNEYGNEKKVGGFGRGKSGANDEELGLPKNGIKVKKAMEWSEEHRAVP